MLRYEGLTGLVLTCRSTAVIVVTFGSYGD